MCGYFFCYPLFFLLYFALFFVGFGGLGLPCHLLCCLLLFVYFILFFFNLIYFYFLFLFYLHGFSGFIFRKFNCSWHFFTSSDRIPPGGGLVARGPRFADWYRGVVSYTSDDLGGRVAWLTWNWWNGTEETVDDGLGRRYLGAGRCPVAPPPWLVMAGRSGRWCQLLCFFFFLIFWKSMVIDGWETCFVCCRGQWRPPCWEVNSTVLSGTLFLLRHRSNCGDYWCSHVVRKGEGDKSKNTPELLGRGG